MSKETFPHGTETIVKADYTYREMRVSGLRYDLGSHELLSVGRFDPAAKHRRTVTMSRIEIE